MKTTKFIRKPLYVDAVQVTQDNMPEVAAWCGGQVQSDDDKMFIQVFVKNPMTPRQSQARVGDWVLGTPKGYKVYTPMAFENAFDVVENQEDVHLKNLDAQTS